MSRVESRWSSRQLALAAVLAAVTSVLAYVRVPLPFSPVPITGQTLGLMLAGLLLGPRIGALSQTVYILMGAVGLPVFAGGQAGIAVLFGPTGGYLWGHVIGAYVTGLTGASDKGPGFWRSFAAAVLGGIATVYVPGVIQLSAVTGMQPGEAVVAGAVPFLLGDMFKAFTAALVIQRLRPLLQAVEGTDHRVGRGR